MNNNIAEAAARLKPLGGLADLRVGLRMRDLAGYVATVLALRERGAGVFPIHPDMPDSRTKDMLARAACDIFLDDHGITRLPGIGRGGELVQMSSGTTGTPKVITRSWAEVATEIDAYVSDFAEPDAMTPVIAAPTTHSYGLIPGLMVGLRRARTSGRMPVVLDNTNPRFILKILRETDRPLLYASPALLHLLAQLTPEPIHAAMTSGTILPEAWFRTIRSRTRHLFQQYGCSELGCISINRDLQSPTDIGHPLSHLAVRLGATVDMPSEIIVTSGGRTVHTGDLARRDRSGRILFVSRSDDMINVAGFNTYPIEIETVLGDCSGVDDAVVFAIADSFAGTRVGVLFAGRAQPDEVLDFALKNLAPFQRPAAIRKVEALPREANGKISRRRVREDFAAGLYDAPQAMVSS
ncbi:AMP-binding protein [Paracoccus halophilus]|uniref:AMP-binding protein n=1 Tax=Paracoccus halophilus TaxID=376733 RepID=UPI001E422648|nr:AMP-binding protein [Paracoccus halophilus]